MAKVLFKGNPIETSGALPAMGQKAPDFELTTDKLEKVTLATHAGKVRVLTLNPSIDTGVCATTTRTFNKRAAGLKDTVVIAASADLPWALKRFCAAEGIEGVVSTSTLRDPGFGDRFGLRMTSGALQNLLARAVIVIGKDDKVVYEELVAEVTTEPNYDAAFDAAMRAAG